MFVPCRFSSELIAIWPAVLKHDIEGDINIVSNSMFKGRGLQFSCSAAAERLGLTRKQIRFAKLRISSCTYHADLMYRLALEHIVASYAAKAPEVKLLLYVDYELYDEASFPLMIAEALKAQGNLASLELATSDSSLATLGQFVAAASRSLGKEPGVAKVVQSISQFAMLMSIQTSADPNDVAFVSVVGESVFGLEAVDRTTAEVTVQLIRQRCMVTLAALHFEDKLRLTMTDHYGANFKAERVRQIELMHWLFLVLGCEAHSTAIVAKRSSNAHFDADISGFKHLASAMAPAGYMNLFRQSLTEVIIERMVWPPLRGEPPLAAIRYRLAAIASLSNEWCGLSALQRRALLQMVPNGDWWTPDVVEWYLHESIVELPAKEHFQKAIAESTVAALCWHKFSEFNGKDWFGLEATVTRPTLIQACHGLMQPAFARFCTKLGAKQVRQLSVPMPALCDAVRPESVKT